jgi:hypothetical protein
MTTVFLLTHKRRGAVAVFRPLAGQGRLATFEERLCSLFSGPASGGPTEKPDVAVASNSGPTSATVLVPSASPPPGVSDGDDRDACGLYFSTVNAGNGGATPASPETVVGLGRFDTAEVLLDLYQGVLRRAGLADGDVGTLVLGVGPGSFTGLRLGCAFANGLLLGRRRRALAVRIPSPSEVEEALAAGLARAAPDAPWPGMLSYREAARDADDPFSAPVSLADVFALACRVDAGEAEGVDEFAPFYGREPGPVLKLRSQGGNV